MKILNITLQKASMPKLIPVKLVSRLFLSSLCAALLLLTCSLSTKAQTGTGPTDLYILPYTLGFGAGQSTYFYDPQCTSCSPHVNNYGDPYTSGSDKWIQIDVADDGYLGIRGGTSDFDSVFYLFDSSWNLITSADDGHGSGAPYGLQPLIETYVNTGTYYLIIDGTNKSSQPTSGSMSVEFTLQ